MSSLMISTYCQQQAIDTKQQKKQHNALAHYVARQQSLIHTADGKYVVIAPDDTDRATDDFADLERELDKYRSNYEKYKQTENEDYLPYDPPRVKVDQGGKAKIVTGATEDSETVGQWLKKREENGQPNYLLPVISEAGLSKVLDLDGEVLKSFKLPGGTPRKPPKSPIAGLPTVLNDNIDKDISEKGSINREDMSPIVTRVEKKCGAIDFIALVREYAEEVASGRMSRAEADQKIDSIVQQQIAIQSKWGFFLMDYKQDWRVEKDGSNPFYIDQDSQADYSDVSTINRDIIDDYNGLTEDYLPDEIVNDRHYTTTPDKYNNYRRGRAALELEINRSLTDEVFQEEVDRISDLIDLINVLIMIKDNNNSYQIPDKIFQQLDTLMQGNMLSKEDKVLIKQSFQGNGKITDRGLRKRLGNLKGIVALVRGKALLKKIEQIKRKDGFVNGKLDNLEDRKALRDLLEVNYLGKEHEELKELILEGDFDNERVKRAMGKLHNGLLKMDDAKERYVRIQAQNRVNLVKQGKIDEAFNSLESSEFNKNLCITLIRDFAKDNVHDLTIDDINCLYRYRDSLNQYLQDQYLDDIEDIHEREQIVRQAINTTLYLATYLEQGKPTKSMRGEVESTGGMSRLRSEKMNIDRTVKRLAKESPDLAGAINREASKHKNKPDDKQFSQRSENLAKHIERANLKQNKIRSQSLYEPRRSAIPRRRYKSTSAVLNRRMKPYRLPVTYTGGSNHWLQKAKTNATHLFQSENNRKKPMVKLPHSVYHGDHQHHHFHHAKKRPNAMLHNPHHSHHSHHKSQPQFRPIIKSF